MYGTYQSQFGFSSKEFFDIALSQAVDSTRLADYRGIMLRQQQRGLAGAGSGVFPPGVPNITGPNATEDGTTRRLVDVNLWHYNMSSVNELTKFLILGMPCMLAPARVWTEFMLTKDQDKTCDPERVLREVEANDDDSIIIQLPHLNRHLFFKRRNALFKNADHIAALFPFVGFVNSVVPSKKKHHARVELLVHGVSSVATSVCQIWTGQKRARALPGMHAHLVISAVTDGLERKQRTKREGHEFTEVADDQNRYFRFEPAVSSVKYGVGSALYNGTNWTGKLIYLGRIVGRSSRAADTNSSSAHIDRVIYPREKDVSTEFLKKMDTFDVRV